MIYTRTCDICSRKFTAATELQASRSLGVHKRFSHGIKGGYKSKAAKSLEARRAQSREYQRKRRAQMATAQLPQAAAEPCKLSECPSCGTRFYLVRGQ